jgi:hypothetical protein
MQYHILTLLGGEKMADAPSIAEQSALSDMDDLHDQKSVLTSQGYLELVQTGLINKIFSVCGL